MHKNMSEYSRIFVSQFGTNRIVAGGGFHTKNKIKKKKCFKKQKALSAALF